MVLDELEEERVEDTVPVGPAVVVELPIVNGALLDELEEPKVEDPVPVGPAMVVELPIVKRALLELELVTEVELTEILAAVGPVEVVLLVEGSEEASDDRVKGMVADEFLGSAELEREELMLVAADPDVLLATVVETEKPVELDADFRVEEDWTSRREVAIANVISLSACRLF
jgi:hypothetical protein